MKISVVGSINMDMTIVAERIPLKGETLKGKELRYVPGGKGANQAVAMARLGADVTMFGCVGADRHGEFLTANLKSQGVCTDYVKKLEKVPTGMAVITVGERDNTIVIVAGANGKVNCAYVDSIAEELIKSDMVVLQHEIPMRTIGHVVDICHANHIPVVLNPAPARKLKPEIIDKITYLTPNEHEAKLLFKGMDFDEMLQNYPEKMIITLGSRGVTTCLKSGRIIQIPARLAKVVDTTGAGDTLNGAFAVMMSEKNTLERALYFANVAASLSTEKFGAQGGMPTRKEVLAELERLNLS